MRECSTKPNNECSSDKPPLPVTIGPSDNFYIRPNGSRLRLWKYECSCGKTFETQPQNVRNGGTISCGCYRKQYVQYARWRGCGQLSGTYWHTVVRNAKSRGLEVAITIEDAWNVFVKQEGKCVITGIELFMDPMLHLSRRNKTSNKHTASLDRIDSSRGYTLDNIRWVHRVVNLMRLAMTDEEFIGWCKKVVEHNAA